MLRIKCINTICDASTKLFSSPSHIGLSVDNDFVSSIMKKSVVPSSNYYDSFGSEDVAGDAYTISDYLNTLKINEDTQLMIPEMPLWNDLVDYVKLRARPAHNIASRATAIVHIGNKDSFAPLHFDWDMQWVAHFCITGSRTLYFIPPRSGWFLQPVINTSAYCLPKMSTHDQYQFSRKLDGRIVQIEAGEGVLFPSMWWHGVRYESQSVALSVRFESTSSFRPLTALPRSWLLQRLADLFFPSVFEPHCADFFTRIVDCFLNRDLSWIEKYLILQDLYREALLENGAQEGVHYLTSDAFNSELHLAAEELSWQYGAEVRKDWSVDDISETRRHLLEGCSEKLSSEHADWLACRALHFGQGLKPSQGIIGVEYEPEDGNSQTR